MVFADKHTIFEFVELLMGPAVLAVGETVISPALPHRLY